MEIKRDSVSSYLDEGSVKELIGCPLESRHCSMGGPYYQFKGAILRTRWVLAKAAHYINSALFYRYRFLQVDGVVILKLSETQTTAIVYIKHLPEMRLFYYIYNCLFLTEEEIAILLLAGAAT